MLFPAKGLYAITDYEHLSHTEIMKKTGEILSAGAVLLQYRNKSGENSESQKQARDVKSICRDFNVPLIINDNIELAIKVDADGLHLGKDDTRYELARDRLGRDRIIGVSCYNDLNLARLAESAGADYVAFGSFFNTNSKNNTVKAEKSLLREARKELRLPLVAIGGITPQNGQELVDAGADFLAVISGLYQSENSYNAARSYIKLFH